MWQYAKHINFPTLFKKGNFTYSALDPGDSRNLMMCRWNSQITSHCAEYSLNPSRLPSPPPPLQLLPFLIPCPYHYLVCCPAHGHTGVFQNNFLWHKLLALIFAINPFLLFSRYCSFSVHFSQYPLPKNACSFLPDNNPRNLFSRSIHCYNFSFFLMSHANYL